MNDIYIDIGSATVKIYETGLDKSVRLIETRSFSFKDNFDPEYGITFENKDALFTYIKEVEGMYRPAIIKVYATAIFRKFTASALQVFKNEFFQYTGLALNVVSHNQENRYLEYALSNGYELDEPLLLMNIGGGSTKLIIIQHNVVVERHNLDLGVITVLAEFTHLNEQISKHKLSEVVDAVTAKLPPSNYRTPFAIYNGGELTYMRLAGYSLQRSDILHDKDHQYSILSEMFAKKNYEIFHSITVGDLEKLMPNDPLWMHGARACSAIAQAITYHFNVEVIIPSDSNMVHGIVKQELK